MLPAVVRSRISPWRPKSTLSNHLKLLRAAGLIETTQAGREMINTLRRDAFDQRFPGLLDAVLANRPA